MTRFVLILVIAMVAGEVTADEPLVKRYRFYEPAAPSGLDAWREKRVRDFWTRTSPFFGDPYYDPMKTSPMSPFRSPQYHPWGNSPFRGDPYYDPYAVRRGRLDFNRAPARTRR